MKSKSKLTKINQKNLGKFLQSPEGILLLEEEDGEELMLNKDINNKGKLQQKKAKQRLKMAQKIGSIIPEILKKAYPNLNYQSYRKIKNMKTVLKQTIPVCEECFLFHTRLNMTAGTVSYSKLLQIIGKSNLYGTGRLRPEVLRLRLEDTIAKIKKDYKFEAEEKKNDLLKTKKEKKLEALTKKLYASDISVEKSVTGNSKNSKIDSSFGEDSISVASKKKNLDDIFHNPNNSIQNGKSAMKSMTTQDNNFSKLRNNLSQDEPETGLIDTSEGYKTKSKFVKSDGKFFHSNNSPYGLIVEERNNTISGLSHNKNSSSNQKIQFKLPSLTKVKQKGLRSKTSMHFYKKNKEKKKISKIKSGGRIHNFIQSKSRTRIQRGLSSSKRKKEAQKMFKMYAGF